MLTLKNNATGVESPMSQEQYDKMVKNDPATAYDYTIVANSKDNKPAEVKALDDKKAAKDAKTDA